MSKIQLFLTSLIAAVPGGILAAMLVFVFLNHGGGPTVMVQGLVAASLGSSVFVALMPLGILVFYRSGAVAAPSIPRTADTGQLAVAGAGAMNAGEGAEIFSSGEVETDDVELKMHDSVPEEGFDLGGFDEEGSLEEEDLSTDENLVATSDEMETEDFESFFDDEKPQK